MFPLIAILPACQTPFGVDRHELDGFRIAAISASSAESGDPVEVSVAIVSDGHLWSDEPVDLRWYWLEDADELVDLDWRDPPDPDGLGPRPDLILPEDGRLLGLLAMEGAKALVEVPESLMPAVSIEADIAELDTKEKATLTATFANEPTKGAHARWMATGGHFSELDATSAEWTAPKDPGTETVLVLALDDAGRAQWSASDFHIGQAGLGIWIGSRWIPSDIELNPGSNDVWFAADDLAPSGVRIEGAGPATGALPACTADVSGPFQPRWLVDGRCARSHVLGVPISLEIE